MDYEIENIELRNYNRLAHEKIAQLEKQIEMLTKMPKTQDEHMNEIFELYRHGQYSYDEYCEQYIKAMNAFRHQRNVQEGMQGFKEILKTKL